MKHALMALFERSIVAKDRPYPGIWPAFCASPVSKIAIKYMPETTCSVVSSQVFLR
jgi:hypothetical protein